MLKGRHVVITGAAGGLGGAVRSAIEEAGATVHAPTRAQLDLTDEAAVTRYYAALPPLWASVHLAGGYAGAPFVETPLATLRAQLDVNVVTAFLCSREAARSMKRAQGGRIVNVASRAALVPGGGSVAYAAAKAAVAALTLSLAEELKADGILVSGIAPGTIDTQANRTAMPTADASKWVKPEEIARTIVWLIGPENTLVSGTILPLYGRG